MNKAGVLLISTIAFLLTQIFSKPKMEYKDHQKIKKNYVKPIEARQNTSIHPTVILSKSNITEFSQSFANFL